MVSATRALTAKRGSPVQFGFEQENPIHCQVLIDLVTWEHRARLTSFHGEESVDMHLPPGGCSFDDSEQYMHRKLAITIGKAALKGAGRLASRRKKLPND